MPIRKTAYLGFPGEFHTCSPITQSTVQTATMCYLFLVLVSCFGVLHYALLGQLCQVPGFGQPHWHLDIQMQDLPNVLCQTEGFHLSHNCLGGSVTTVRWWGFRALEFIPLCYSQRFTGGRVGGWQRGRAERVLWRQWQLCILATERSGILCREFRTMTKLTEIGLLSLSLCADDSKQYRGNKYTLPCRANHSHQSSLQCIAVYRSLSRTDSPPGGSSAPYIHNILIGQPGSDFSVTQLQAGTLLHCNIEGGLKSFLFFS